MGLGHSSHGLQLGELLKHVLLAPGIILFHEAVHKWGVDAGGGNAVAANILSNVVARYRVRHRQHCAFAHGIGEAIGKASGGSDGGEIQDYSAATGLHVVDPRIHAVVDTFHVDAEDAIEVLFTGGFQLANVRDAGIVHKNVNRIAAADFAENILDLLLVRYVASVPLSRPALLTNGHGSLLCIGFIEFENVDCSPLLRKAERDRLADATGPSSDDGNFAVETI